MDLSNCPHKTSDSCGCGTVKVRGVTEEKYCPIGTHEVTIEACDQDNNCTYKPIEVTVEDTTKPTFKLSTFNDMLWPPNHKLVKVAEVTNVFDLADLNPDVNITVASNEPLNGRGDGNTDFDWEVVKSGDVWEVWLRSERAGNLSGRDYTINVSVTDDSGNSATAQGTVSVPHDMRNKKK